MFLNDPFKPDDEGQPVKPPSPTPEDDAAAANALIDGTARLFGAPEEPAPAIDFAPARELLARDQERIQAISRMPDPLAEQERRRTNLDTAIEGFADLAIKAPKPEDASWATRRAESFARVGELAGHLPPGGAEQRIQKLHDRIDHGHAERVLKRDPAELQTLLADPDIFAGLSPENRAFLRDRATARVEHAPLDRAFKAERAGLQDQVARVFAREAREGELAGASAADIAEAVAKGEITPAQRARLESRARATLRAEQRDARAITRMIDLRARGYDRDDPEHRALAETYAARAVKAWSRTPPPEFAGALGAFIRDTGDVPPAVDRVIRVAFARGTPGYQAATSDALMRLKDRPDVLARVDSLALLEATANHALRRNGARPEEAAAKSFDVLRGGGEGFRGANDRVAVIRAVDALHRALRDDARAALRDALPPPLPDAPLGPLDWNRLLTPVTHREPAPMEPPVPARQPTAGQPHGDTPGIAGGEVPQPEIPAMDPTQAPRPSFEAYREQLAAARDRLAAAATALREAEDAGDLEARAAAQDAYAAAVRGHEALEREVRAHLGGEQGDA